MTGDLHHIRQLLETGQSAILVHVVDVKGSAPREVGAHMAVSAQASHGTIGGGELELRAIRHARELLDAGRSDLVGFSLGPELGQCCGGAVRLAFEIFAPADRAFVERALTARNGPEQSERIVEITTAGDQRREIRPIDATASLRSYESDRDRVVLRLPLTDDSMSVWLFGAGHVGRALVQALAPLDVAVTWIDARAGQFPDNVPPEVRTLELAMPELIVDEAPAGAFYFVMTHSHPLDEEICAAVLRRDDFAYLGLIGSATKRARFRKRLAGRGLDPKTIDKMHCPIGLPGLKGKAPAVVAASVVADLLLRRQDLMKTTTAPAVGEIGHDR